MALPEEIESINNIEENPDDFTSITKGLENDIFAGAVPLLDAFQTDEDGVLLLEENIGVPDQVATEIETVINESGYLDAYNEYIGTYDEQAQNSMNLIRELMEDETLAVSGAAAVSLALSKKQAGDLFIREGLQNNVILPIRSQLEEILAGLGTKQDLIRVLNDSLISNDQRQALLTNLVSTNSIDRYATANAQFNTIQSQTTDGDWYTYRGGTVRDSRKFCKQRNRKFYHEKEIREWGNIKNWQGRKRGTNPGNIFINRGGYNCLHSIMPVSITRVPKDVLERNIKNGNWKPTESEKRVLDIN